MRFLFIFCAFLCSQNALSKGTLTVKKLEAYHQDDEGKDKYVLGLGVYEPFLDSMAYVGWYGAGCHEDKAENWFKTEQGLEANFLRMSIGSGVYYLYTPHTGEKEVTYYGSLGYRLWD